MLDDVDHDQAEAKSENANGDGDQRATGARLALDCACSDFEKTHGQNPIGRPVAAPQLQSDLLLSFRERNQWPEYKDRVKG